MKYWEIGLGRKIHMHSPRQPYGPIGKLLKQEGVVRKRKSLGGKIDRDFLKNKNEILKRDLRDYGILLMGLVLSAAALVVLFSFQGFL